MRTILPWAILLVAFAYTPACSAKMDFYATNCIIESVTIQPAKIVMVVSGDCSFIAAEGKESSGAVRYSSAKMLMDSTTVVIPRRDDANTYKSWDEYSAKAKALAGKKVFLQLQTVYKVIENAKLVFISAHSAQFHEVTQ